MKISATLCSFVCALWTGFHRYNCTRIFSIWTSASQGTHLGSAIFMPISVVSLPVATRRGGGGSWYKLPGPHCVTYVFVFLSIIIIGRLYRLTPSDQPQATVQPRVSPSVLVILCTDFWPVHACSGARSRSRRPCSLQTYYSSVRFNSTLHPASLVSDM
jgi:hypothetical protein